MYIVHFPEFASKVFRVSSFDLTGENLVET